MMHEIHFVANPVIGESALPYLAFSANDSADLMGISTLDQLDGPLDGHVNGGSQQQMNMFGHDNNGK
jgi:hypothetical protein